MTNYIQNFISELAIQLNQLTTSYGLTDATTNKLTSVFTISALLLITVGCFFIFKKALEWSLRFFSNYLKIKFFGLLINNHTQRYVSLWLCYYIVRTSVEVVFDYTPDAIQVTNKMLYITVVFVSILALMSIIKAGFDTLREKENYHDRPINSYLQVIRIILTIIGLVLIASDLTGKPWENLFAAMGAASAIFLLMFKDMIMGFVASVQVTSNDMVRIGDWITMPKYGADGDVIEITLTTVKVSNFDKTITTIPTYALISDSFQNWRGMFRSGGRRIKRAIIIKQSSIRYIADDELVRFKKIQGISDYIDQRQEDIRKHNEQIHADRTIPVNGRNLTNAGLFRKYTEWYLNNHPGTNKEMILMVRQLAPTEFGIPLELYAFTNTTKWVEYEYIMADIFDHLIAAVRYFDLHIYERQSGSDVQRLEMVDSDFNQFDKNRQL